MLLVVSGLPGTGKSAVSAAVAATLGAVHLSVDVVEDALLAAGLPASWTTGVAAYEAVGAAAGQNLALGRTVVVDAVNDSEPARGTWRRAADGAGSPLRFVRLVLDDADEHRRRLEGRSRPLVHVSEPTWEDVLQRSATYAPWPDCPTVDAVAPVDEVAAAVVDLAADG